MILLGPTPGGIPATDNPVNATRGTWALLFRVFMASVAFSDCPQATLLFRFPRLWL